MNIEIKLLFRPEITNYYHFINDFCAQLYYELNNRNLFDQKVNVFLSNKPEQIGKYLQIFCLIFDNITYIINGSDKIDLQMEFDYFKNPTEVLKFKDYVLNKLYVSNSTEDFLLLIEREEDTIKHKKITKIRLLENHNILRNRLSFYARNNGLIFKNVRLAEIDFKEQIYLFRNSKIVVGQHGAGLLNLIWMEPNSYLIEIGHYFWNDSKLIKRYMFEKMSVKAEINYIYSEPIMNNIANVRDIILKIKESRN